MLFNHQSSEAARGTRRLSQPPQLTLDLLPTVERERVAATRERERASVYADSAHASSRLLLCHWQVLAIPLGRRPRDRRLDGNVIHRRRWRRRRWVGPRYRGPTHRSGRQWWHRRHRQRWRRRRRRWQIPPARRPRDGCACIPPRRRRRRRLQHGRRGRWWRSWRRGRRRRSGALDRGPSECPAGAGKAQRVCLG